MKKRLLIFSFYDSGGIVDKYLESYLDSLIKCISECIIVVNGFVDDSGKEILNKYADKLIIRENKGFDAGAYKAAMLETGFCYIRKFDELILANDTCFGPFIDFEDIFNEMAEKSCDFWGINYIERGRLSFLDSYFLVFGKKIINDAEFERYFGEIIDENALETKYAISLFEIGLFKKLCSLGFKFDYYSDFSNFNIYTESYKLIKDYKYPFVKKKSFDESNSYCYDEINTINTLLYLKKIGFDIKIILENAKRLYDYKLEYDKICSLEICENNRAIIERAADEKEIISFCEGKEPVYIYGTGVFSACFCVGYRDLMNKFRGFVVSDGQPHKNEFFGMKVYELSETDKSKSKFLLALIEKNANEVKKILGSEAKALYLFKNEIVLTKENTVVN